jgi:hypothetical protein
MKRRPTETDLAGWFDETPLPPRPVKSDRENLRELIRVRNPVRWYRMQKDLEWVRRQLIKLGRDPNEAKWLL